MVDKGCAGTDDAIPRAVKRLKILLFSRFDRHEAHRRAHSRFINSFGIRRVVLGSFDEWLHEARIDQENPMARGKKAPAPIVRAGASLHRDRLWSQFFDRLDQLRAARLARDDHAIVIDGMNVKRTFTEINSK